MTRKSTKEQIKEAKDFIDEMNSGGAVAEMFRRMVTLTATLIRRQKGITDEVLLERIRLRYVEEINLIKARIAKKYPTWKPLDHFSKGGSPVFVEAALFRGRSVTGQIKEMEAAVLLDLYQRLTESEMLGKLWSCSHRLPSGDSCRNFFFAHRKTKTMSCPACYRRAYNQLPEVKKANAKYQRKYYRDWLSVDAVKKHRGKKPRKIRGR